MVTVEQWTGREAVLLQSVMRLSNRDFARVLGVSFGTVMKWRRQGAELVPLPATQQILDSALRDRCTDEEREAFYARLSPTVPAQSAAPAASGALPAPCVVVSHKFLPVYVGERLAAAFGAGQDQRPGPGGLEQRTLSVEHRTAEAATVHSYACGVAVVHLEEHHRLETLTDLAVWRYRSYLTDRAWAGRQLATLLPGHGPGACEPHYVLSAYELRDHAWDDTGRETALQLLTTPSVLVNREDPDNVVPLASGTEAERFTAGWQHPEAIPFSGGASSSLGFAGWSGVAYHPHAEESALTMADIVALELDAQALWALSSHILAMVEAGQDPVMPGDFGWRYLRGAYSRLTAARPVETAQHRAMREAILATSELPYRLRSAQDALRDSSP
ncbi:XRE family transcriptional regulator [Streptomyces sp. NPDC048516]|uniref:XRE family transcriptional regulator n=1 Tax=Streptomyces sp. NPDC048516 TaxID=3365565 RepID=UPI00371D455A